MATVGAEVVRARTVMTRVDVVEVVHEITVEVPAPLIPAGSYTEREVCVRRGMRPVGQSSSPVPAAT
ncbi:hypothetical protein ACIGW8_39390 [Streptomyces sioyaensis]|uniref:hypothetical protein n=1 Tax=Streptomyces sioyaensis TaxID=67364 RepID=UPI0037D0690A